MLDSFFVCLLSQVWCPYVPIFYSCSKRNCSSTWRSPSQNHSWPWFLVLRSFLYRASTKLADWILLPYAPFLVLVLGVAPSRPLCVWHIFLKISFCSYSLMMKLKHSSNLDKKQKSKNKICVNKTIYSAYTCKKPFSK